MGRKEFCHSYISIISCITIQFHQFDNLYQEFFFELNQVYQPKYQSCKALSLIRNSIIYKISSCPSPFDARSSKYILLKLKIKFTVPSSGCFSCPNWYRTKQFRKIIFSLFYVFLQPLSNGQLCYHLRVNLDFIDVYISLILAIISGPAK